MNRIGAGSTEPGAPATTMSWTLSQSANWALLGASVKAAKVRMAFSEKGSAQDNLDARPFDRAIAARLRALEAEGADLRYRLRD